MNPTLQAKLLSFFQQFEIIKLAEGVTLLSPTEESKGIYFLKDGFIRQFATSSSGKELTIHILVPGSFFPISWAINHYKDPYTFECLTDSTVYLAPEKEVTTFLQLNPELVWDLTSRLLRANSGLTKRLESLAFDSAYKRVVSILIYLATHFGKNDPAGLTLPHFTHESLAHLAALSRDRTSLEMDRLKKQRLITIGKNHTIIIRDWEKLQLQLSS